ncbi:SRPBCC family protein [Zhihengliuella salsuginis]|uniref:Cyclase n=1 Tax=Zhihengliuella salsuginis TaxID=578222 RepID=A0ABQ3GAI5_9MICC|nr:SRPBCC family protein [Zhihengliuella salsuginis]GHC99746.1 cyclase [Zhihengliuella salsuginis]
MATVSERIEVNVPVETAYDEWTQFESFPRFMHAVESVTQVDDVTSRWAVSVAGVEREFDTRITEQVPDEVIAWESIDGKGHNGRVTFQSIEVVDPESRSDRPSVAGGGPMNAGIEVGGVARGWDPDLGARGDVAPRGRPGTLIDVEITWDDETFLERLGDKLGLDDAQVKRDLRRFKKLVEKDGAEGGWRGEIHDGREQSGGEAPGGTA